MQFRTILLSFLVIMLFFFSVLVFGCDTNDSAISDPIEPEQIEEIIEEEELITLSEKDFTFEIGTLPYRGAVLFIDYEGEVDLSDYNLFFDVISDGEIKQENMSVEEVDGNLTATIVDLMYLPGDELEFTLKIKQENNLIFECFHSQQLQRYPWKDWMLADDEWFSLNPNDNFVYGKPSWGGVGCHASWDIVTSSGKAANVYSGTVGLVCGISAQYENFEIYNPYVGAVVQYGHTDPVEGVYVGKMVMPGEYIANVIPAVQHIHYSIIRPFKYTKIDKNVIERFDYVPESLMGLYWFYLNQNQASIYDLKYYRDPFYWHEPTTLGYWYEETLPSGAKQEMLSKFQKYNPGVVLPATKQLDTE